MPNQAFQATLDSAPERNVRKEKWDYFAQFWTLRLVTRRSSRSLPVTTVSPSDNAWAATIVSNDRQGTHPLCRAAGFGAVMSLRMRFTDGFGSGRAGRARGCGRCITRPRQATVETPSSPAPDDSTSRLLKRSSHSVPFRPCRRLEPCVKRCFYANETFFTTGVSLISKPCET
jgi:hypothetical protein